MLNNINPRLVWFFLLNLVTLNFAFLLAFDVPLLQDWAEPSKVMRAFQIGKLEAQSITNLMKHVPKSVVDGLWDAVRPRGMRTWITHECLARDLFNVSYSSANGSWEAWKAECVNRHDDHTLALWRNDSSAHVQVLSLLIIVDFSVGGSGKIVLWQLRLCLKDFSQSTWFLC